MPGAIHERNCLKAGMHAQIIATLSSTADHIELRALAPRTKRERG